MCFVEAMKYVCLVLVKVFICRFSLKVLSLDDNLIMVMLSIVDGEFMFGCDDYMY